MSQKDEKEDVLTKGIDRREFIKRTAIGAGAVAATMVAGCGGSSTSTPATGPVAASVGPNSTINKTAWKFAVMGDTQWVATNDDGKNPNAVPVDIINQLNQQFIAQGVNFVVQVGDMTENASSAGTSTGYELVNGVSTAKYTYTNLQAEDLHAAFIQTLYNAGIGYFAHRGNHDSDPTSAAEFVRIYPQNLNGVMNATPADVINTPNFDSSVQPFPAVKSSTTFTVGATNFSSPSAADVGSANLKGLTYSFDVNNARFVLIDQFNPLDNLGPDGKAAYNIDTTVAIQQPWVKKVVANSQQHTFVFSHKGLITQQHQDVLFGECPADANFAAPANVVNGVTIAAAKTITGAIGMNDFIRTLSSNKVKLYFCGHDHNHNRSIVKTTDSGAAGQVTHVLCQSCSSKFYTPNENNSSGNGSVPPCTSNDAFYCGGKRQTQLSQEVYTVGYYIVTVDGPNVAVDYYSAPTYPIYSKSTEQQILTTPTLNFTKRETFGYSQIGQQFVLGNGASFTTVKDTGPSGTAAAILSGTCNNPNTDLSGRQYYNAVNTGWWTETSSIASDILALWGMGYTLGSSQTDVYTLSLTYDTKKGGALVLATPDGNGNWINAVDQNLGGAKTFVQGPWKAGYALGTYGIDTASGTVWAVINYNGYFAAVAGV
jgi:hypothetical protein